MIAPHMVYVVDDDEGMRKSLALLLTAANFQVVTFDSADTFLKAYSPDMTGCLVLDVQMPKMSGLELQDYLISEGINLPIIFITAHGDVPTAVKAMKHGSFDFIEKPYSAQALLEGIYKAILKDCENRAELARRSSAQEKIKVLSEREREILIMVVLGKSSKVIAEVLGLTVSTIDNHRARIMKKLQVETAAELTRIALVADPHLLNHPSNNL